MVSTSCYISLFCSPEPLHLGPTDANHPGITSFKFHPDVIGDVSFSLCLAKHPEDVSLKTSVPIVSDQKRGTSHVFDVSIYKR
jgi:hypothetical protein